MEKLLRYYIYVCSITRHRKTTLHSLFKFRRTFQHERAIRTINRTKRSSIRNWITLVEKLLAASKR